MHGGGAARDSRFRDSAFTEIHKLQQKHRSYYNPICVCMCVYVYVCVCSAEWQQREPLPTSPPQGARLHTGRVQMLSLCSWTISLALWTVTQLLKLGCPSHLHCFTLPFSFKKRGGSTLYICPFPRVVCIECTLYIHCT